MRNRAKCRLCGDILESKNRHDNVECSCEEIGIDGGSDYFKAYAKDWRNFIRLDDDDKEVIPKIVDKEPVPDPVKEERTEALPHNLTKKDHIDAITDMINLYDRLPDDELRRPVSQYDHYSLLILIRAFLTAEN